MPDETYSLEPVEERSEAPRDPRPAPPPSPTRAQTILDDRPCQGCKYNLRGLPENGRCPECGLAISEQPESLRSSPAFRASPVMAVFDRAVAELSGSQQGIPKVAVCPRCGHSLEGRPKRGWCPECGLAYSGGRFADMTVQDLPQSLISRYRYGSWLAVLSVAVTMATSIGIGPLTANAQVHLLVTLAAAAAWITASWLLTPTLRAPAAVKRGFGRSSWLRRASRWLAWGWMAHVLASHSPMIAPLSQWPGWLLTALATAGSIVGLAGVGSLMLLLIRLADWTRDELAQRAFNLVLWGTFFGQIALTALVMVMDLVGGVMMIFLPVVWVLELVAMASVLGLPVGLFSLARSLDWCMQHAHEKEEREEAQRRRLAAVDAKSHTPQWTAEQPMDLAPPSDRHVEIHELGSMERRRSPEQRLEKPRPPTDGVF